VIISDGFYNNATFSDYGVESRSVYVTLLFFFSVLPHLSRPSVLPANKTPDQLMHFLT